MTRCLRLWLVVVILAIPAVVLPDVVRHAAALYPLADGTGRYFVGSSAALVYVLVPLVAASASVLFLGPGLMLALAAGRGTSVSSWLLGGLALSLPVVSLAGGIATAVHHAPVTGSAFGIVCLLATTACGGVALQTSRRRELAWPLSDPGDRLQLAVAVLVPTVLLALLAPKFLWESFNGDGAHAFESSRLLLRHPLPFWPAGAGDVGAFPGLNSMLFAFPNGWYLRLFGEVEASVRLPFLLYLPVLVAAVLAMVEQGRSRPLLAAVWLSALAFALAMMFSATYDPYSADVALPATQDTLLVIAALGWLAALLRRQWAWALWFTFLTYTASPNGLLLMGFSVVAIPLALRHDRWRLAIRAGALLFACVLLVPLITRLLLALGSPSPGAEHGPLGLIRHFAYLQLTDWRRLIMVGVAGGIAPLCCVFFWKRLDDWSRLLLLCAGAMFLFYFVLAHTSLHHFVPAMVLPVAAAARYWSGPPAQARLWQRAWILGGLVALLLSLPRSFLLADQRRAVGATVAELIGGYETSSPRVLRATTLLHAGFPYDWESSVPDSSYGGSPLVWNHYGSHDGMTAATNYVLTSRETPPPPGMQVLASDSAAVLYMRSNGLRVAQLALRPPTPPGSPVYAFDRGILFHRAWPLAHGPKIIDTAALLARLGIDVGPILARLGVKRH